MAVLRTTTLRLLACLWAMFLAFATARGADAAADAAERNADAPALDVQLGLAGAFKVGHWTPVHVTITAGSSELTGHLEFEAPDNDDVLTRLACSSARLRIEPGQQWRGWRYVKIGRMRSKLLVTLRGQDGAVVLSRQVANLVAQPSTALWLLSAGRDVEAEKTIPFLARMQEERVFCGLLKEAHEFPDQWYGYDGVNVLIAATGETNVLESLSTEQFQALLQWIKLGGRLVLSSSGRAGELFAEDHAFHVLRPGEYVEQAEYWKASGLEHFAQAGEPVDPDQMTPLAVFTQLRGRSLCLEGAGGARDRALVQQYPFGFGAVTYLALDLDRPPLSGWSARPRLLARLLQPLGADGDTARGGRTSQVTHLGYQDMTGQLRAALEQFPGIKLVQFSWIAGLLVAYLLLLGPVDFFLLRRIGRPHWTWFTFPLLVVAFTGLSVWLFRHWKGAQPQVNQVEIVDVDVTDKLVRGTSWATVYSPTTAALDAHFTAAPALPSRLELSHSLVSWQGLPGTGMGGMNSPAASRTLASGERTQSYGIDTPCAAARPTDTPQITHLPLQTASTKSLVARWSGSVDLGPAGPLTAKDLSLLEGSVTNPLNVELTHCSVYYQNWAYPLDGALAPGATVQLGGQQPLDLRWRLTRRSVVGSQEIRTTWQRDDVSDMDRLAEMMMFYGAAGGQLYTGLSHNYQGFIDLSHQLGQGRAILVGRCPRAASTLSITPAAGVGEGAEPTRQQWTYYRIVLPVQPATD